MESLKNLATFDVKIKGRVFTMRHRCTALMVLIGDIRTTLGQMAMTKAKDLTPEESEKAMKAMADNEMKAVEVALVAIDGEEVEIVSDEIEAGFVVDGRMRICSNDLIAFAPALARAFNGSGLIADPIESS